MALQKLNPQATVIQLPIDVCLWLLNGSRCFQRALISKKDLDILIMTRNVEIPRNPGFPTAAAIKNMDQGR